MSFSLFLQISPKARRIYNILYKITGECINIGMVICPSIGYITQCIKFRSNGTSYGFSLSICFKLLISNLLRVLFWVGLRFNIYLLYQALSVMFCQFIVINRYLHYRDPREIPPEFVGNQKQTSIANQIEHFKREYLTYERFWEWNDFYCYIIYFFFIVIGSIFISLFFGFDNMIYMNLLGAISIGIDAVMTIPQIIINYKLKSGDALSVIMIVTWIMGEAFKTVYYIVTKVPIQFIAGGIIQVFLNFTILFQIFYYHKGPCDFIEKEIFVRQKNKNNNSNKNEENDKLLKEKDRKEDEISINRDNKFSKNELGLKLGDNENKKGLDESGWEYETF